jgi:hypothetical protein
MNLHDIIFISLVFDLIVPLSSKLQCRETVCMIRTQKSVAKVLKNSFILLSASFSIFNASINNTGRISPYKPAT